MLLGLLILFLAIHIQAAIQSERTHLCDSIESISFENSFLNFTTKNRLKSSTKILFVTFVSKNIYEYAKYSLLLNFLYFRENNIDFVVLGNESSHYYHEFDPRWNKVMLLHDGMNSWGKEYDFISFIDADLFIIDHSFNVLEILETIQDKDVFMCSDELDVANTGFIVARNTPWSSNFLLTWWRNRFMPNTFCDQHVLNTLLLDIRGSNDDRVALLPGNAFNSRWPLMDSFLPKDKVIHILGEINAVRIKIFKYFVDYQCLGGHFDEMNLSKELFQRLGRDAIYDGVMNAWNQIVSSMEKSSLCSIDNFTEFLGWLNRGCDKNRPYYSIGSFMCQDYLESLLSVFDQAELNCDFLDEETRYQLGELRLQVLFDAIGFAEDHQVYYFAQRYLESLILFHGIHGANRNVEEYYLHRKKALLWSMLSSFAGRMMDWERSYRNAEISHSELLIAINVSTSLNGFDEVLTSVKHDYSRISSKLSFSAAKLHDFESALQWAIVALENMESFYQSNSLTENRIIAEDLSKCHLDVAERAIPLLRWDIGFQSLKKSLEIYNKQKSNPKKDFLDRYQSIEPIYNHHHIQEVEAASAFT